ncbi:hypothetical protein [Janibacter limosus]|uniref:hypothetical protein n=1 Tax=Janibacter limosus TaxID=53458 RepID=UPI0008304D2B|nr:hypothetical protein [Janibacter limosus]
MRRRFRRQRLHHEFVVRADWISDRYRQAYNDNLAKLKKAGVTTKGKVETTSMHVAESDPDAAGGWELSMYVCVVSTVRL